MEELQQRIEYKNRRIEYKNRVLRANDETDDHL